MARRPQVQTDLGQPEQVRTVARPNYSRAPVHTLGQSRAGALVKSLSAVSPTLSGYIEEFEQDYREDEANRAYDTIQGMTFEESQQLVKSGQLRDTESPWYQAAFEKQFGMAYAGRRKREILDRYNNEFDKHNGNVDEFLSQFAGEDLDKFGGSDFIMAGYRSGMQGVLETVRNDHAEFTSQWTKERTVDNFSSIVRTTMDAAVEYGDNPMEAVRALYKDHKETFGMTFGQMDDAVFDLVGVYAEAGDVEAVNAILSYNAVGEDGTKVGSFLSRPKYAAKARQLAETAKANRGESNRKVNTSLMVDFSVRASQGTLTADDYQRMTSLQNDEQMSQAQVEALRVRNETAKTAGAASAYVSAATSQAHNEALSLVVAGQGALVEDFSVTNPETGKVTTVSADKLREVAVQDAMKALETAGEDPRVMAAELASMGTNVTYGKWEAAISDGYLALNEATASVDKDGNTKLPEAALLGYSAWKSMSEFPNLRSRHTDNKDAERVWRAADLLERRGVPLEDALLRASSVISAGPAAMSNRLSRKEIENIAGLKIGGMFDGQPVDMGRVTSYIEEQVNLDRALGASSAQAVENALKAFEEDHVLVNGYAVNTRAKFLPQNFEEASMALLEGFAEQHGEDVDDLTLVPAHDGSDYWVVAEKANVGIPVPVAGRTNRFHISQLQEAADELEALEVAEIAAAEEAAKLEAEKAISTRAREGQLKEQAEADFKEWRTLTRKERRERGWPVSIIGAQNYFSANRLIKQDRKKQAKVELEVSAEDRRAAKELAREALQSPEADAIFEQMGIIDPANR